MDEKITNLLRGLEILEDFNITNSKDYFLIEGEEKVQFEQALQNVQEILENLKLDFDLNNSYLKDLSFNISMIKLNKGASFSVIQEYINMSRDVLEILKGMYD